MAQEITSYMRVLKCSNTNNQFSGNKYIRYLPSLQITNIFDVHFQPNFEEQIYLLFILDIFNIYNSRNLLLDLF